MLSELNRCGTEPSFDFGALLTQHSFADAAAIIARAAISERLWALDPGRRETGRRNRHGPKNNQINRDEPS
jgi:alpha-D-ribose 1-methylphosphonate 5-triphosphate synthase subunit PhnL